MITGRTAAWLNLAYHFGTHVLLRLPRRVLFRNGDAERFLSAVRPEGYLPLTPDERMMMPAAMRCMSCGLCALASAEISAASHSAWDDAWTFVAGPSRSLDHAALTARGPLAAADDDAAAVCPAGIPIPELARMHRRLAAEGEL